MSDALDYGITVSEIPAVDAPINVSAETVAAFVGRTLRGPVNTPVKVDGLAAFKRRFGGDWSRSGLPEAVRQFFEHGGRTLWIVRVANGARGSMLCLPASGSALVLRAVEPGSTEALRAAIDYDGIDGHDDHQRFNLTLQRVDPDSQRVVDQELYRDISVDPSDDRFVVDALSMSTLARVSTPYPAHRPEPTGSDYLFAEQAGNDGDDLSDYDLIGSRSAESGLFALDGIDRLDLLYLPAPGRDVEAGPAALLVAEQYCRSRGAMLLVDPLRRWLDAGSAIRGRRDSGLESPNLLSYFPRVRDKDDAREVDAGGAIAGLLCRLDREYGAWHAADTLSFARRLQPAFVVDEADRLRLQRNGINSIAMSDTRRVRLEGDRIAGRDTDSQSLSTRRTVLKIVNSIDHATRWAMFEASDADLIDRVTAQIRTFLSCLADLDAFESDVFTLDCAPLADGRYGLSIDLGFTPYRAAAPMYLTLQQSAPGLTVVNTAFARHDL